MVDKEEEEKIWQWVYGFIGFTFIAYSIGKDLLANPIQTLLALFYGSLISSALLFLLLFYIYKVA